MTGLKGSVSASSVLLYSYSVFYLFCLHVVSWGHLKGDSVIGLRGLITERSENGGWLSSGSLALDHRWGHLPMALRVASLCGDFIKLPYSLVARLQDSQTKCIFYGLALKSHGCHTLLKAVAKERDTDFHLDSQGANVKRLCGMRGAHCHGQLWTMSSTVPRV